MRNRVFGMTTSRAVLLLGLVLVMVIAVGGAIAGTIADGQRAPGRGIEVTVQRDDGQQVTVAQTDDGDIQNGKKFMAQGMQIAAGVPLQVDDPLAGYGSIVGRSPATPAFVASGSSKRGQTITAAEPDSVRSARAKPNGSLSASAPLPLNVSASEAPSSRNTNS